MRVKKLFNENWKFYYGELQTPSKTVRKAAAIGGYTSVLENEKGDVVPLGAGGHHFLNLISGGNEKRGLAMLAGTNLSASLDGWKDVNLPHDFKTELPYVESMELFMSGSKPNGVGYYRKTFSLEKEMAGKSISIYFDGVCRSASVWFNGCFLGDHYSGYTGFSFDLSDLARYGDEGENVILVRVDMTTGSEGWWYDGAGIYRDVHLVITDSIHIDKWGVYVETQKIEDEKAYINVETDISNDGYKEKEIEVRVSIKFNGLLFSKAQTEKRILKPLEKVRVKETFVLKKPILWSIENPIRYKAVVEILRGTKIIDCYEVDFGIRKIEYTLKGLFVNGKYTEIKGVCEHQDFAVVGTAVTKDINRYKIKKMKELGVNAYRSAHHAASEDFLDLCDEMGILVMEENRVLESSELHLKDVVDMVKRDRNHPCIFCWSLSNEEVIGSTIMAERMAARIAATIRKLDKSRFLISAELLDLEGKISSNYIDIFDVIGVNYPESAVMGEGLELIKRKYPNKPIMNTESASYFSTRGIYEDSWENCQTNNFGSCYSMFSPEPLPVDAPGAGGTAHPERVMDFFKTHPFMGGSFIWTAFDYYGEPAPFPWPAISSQFGIMDNCGFEKDYFYYYQARWCDKPIIHGMPHWNLSGKEGQEIEVRVFSNCEEAEVIINGDSIGKKKCGEHFTSWNPKYIPGVLEIVGYINGKEAVRETKKTSGEASKLEMRILSDEGSDVLIEIYALDKDGNEVPTADNEVTLKVEGEAYLKGMANGNPIDHTPNKSNIRSLFSGKLLGIISKNHIDSAVKIKVVSDGLELSERSI